MASVMLADLLAQVTSSMMYVSPIKLAIAVVSFGLWAVYAPWQDKDAVAVNTYRVAWNLVVLVGGIVAVAALLLVPVFWIGLLIYWVIIGAVMISYVLHRNGLVNEQDKILTREHIAALMAGKGKGKGKKRDVREKVRLTDARDKGVALPEEDEAREQFALAQDVLFDLLWRRANVAEFAPAGEQTRIAYLVDGVPQQREPVPRAEGEAIVTFLKQHAGLNLQERRKPQRGKLGAALGDVRFELVIQTAGSTAGEKLVIRVVGDEKSYRAPDLGFTDEQLALVREAMDRKGLVLASAPRRSGLTTMLYTLARSHDAFMKNIQTLEYDIEGEVENITQKRYQPSDERTFAAELLKIIRTDPDVLIVPEIRDTETAEHAAKAAGHKQHVLTGVRADSVFEALAAWIKLVNDKPLAAKGLSLVVNGRLVRKLCDVCREQYKPDAPTLRKLNLPPDTLLYRQPEPQYDKNGNPILCEACQGTGYVGRTGVFEVLSVDDNLRKVIASANSIAEIQSAAVRQGTLGLQKQAIQKVLIGVTDIQEVIRVLRGGKPAAGQPTAPAAA